MLEMQHHIIISDVLPLTNEKLHFYLLYVFSIVLFNAMYTGFNYQYI